MRGAAVVCVAHSFVGIGAWETWEGQGWAPEAADVDVGAGLVDGEVHVLGLLDLVLGVARLGRHVARPLAQPPKALDRPQHRPLPHAHTIGSTLIC